MKSVTHVIVQLFRLLSRVGVLHVRFLALEFVFTLFIHCDDVSAYDLRFCFTEGGNGS